tara:strand:+ start:4100 stop:4990 length:891 start_codon:yes stop_codon:yes gene_type:complete
MNLSTHKYLVDTDWLAEHLHKENLVVVEATSLLPNYFEETVTEGIEKESGKESWEQDHIPGSTYVGILEEISDTQDEQFMYGLPSAERFAAVMSRNGIGNDSAVVIYDRSTNMWAARLWWMLRVFGFDNAVVLDGGYTKWLKENRPVDSQVTTRVSANFIPEFQPQMFADRHRVLDATVNDNTCLINALTPDEFEGKPPQRYERSGRIPSSVNVPFTTTVNIDSQLYEDDINAMSTFKKVGVSSAEEIICYCGGGIAACSTALILARLGFERVSVYEGSMTEWAADSALPLDSGTA